MKAPITSLIRSIRFGASTTPTAVDTSRQTNLKWVPVLISEIINFKNMVSLASAKTETSANKTELFERPAHRGQARCYRRGQIDRVHGHFAADIRCEQGRQTATERNGQVSEP